MIRLKYFLVGALAISAVSAIAAYFPSGNLSDPGTDGITVMNGVGAVVGIGTSFSQAAATGSQNGYLKSADWTTFNAKAPIASPTFTGIVTAPSFVGALTGNATNITGINTTGSIPFSNGTNLAQDNSLFFWDETNKGLRIGTNAAIGTGLEGITNSPTYTSLSAASFGINNLATLTTASANSFTLAGQESAIQRTSSGSVTDTGNLEGQSGRVQISIPTSDTYTSSASTIAGLVVSSLDLLGGGSLTLNYQGINIQNDSTAVTGYKNGIQFNTWSGGTNNALIADNKTYSGSYAINLSSTNPSTLGGNFSIGSADPFSRSYSKSISVSSSGTSGLEVNGAASGNGEVDVGINGTRVADFTAVFGTPVVAQLVTNGSYALNLGTNNLTALTLDTSQNATFAGSATVSSLAGSGTRAVTVNSAGLLGAGGTATYTAPTVQSFTSGSGTYTTPVNVLYIKIKMVGGGGGGGGSGTSKTVGTAGNTTSFGTSLLTCIGGGAGQIVATSFATGGSATINSPAIKISGTSGGNGAQMDTIVGGTVGGAGAVSPFGGAGAGGNGGQNGQSASSNTGSGGGGAGGSTGSATAGGGGAGGYIEAIINSPSSSYSYVVGAAATGGTGAQTGGQGGSGYIVVEEHYQ